MLFRSLRDRFPERFATARSTASELAESEFTGRPAEWDATWRAKVDAVTDNKKTERTELEFVRTKPIPFPPEPLRSIGINLSRWSLDQADRHAGRENLWLKSEGAKEPQRKSEG